MLDIFKKELNDLVPVLEKNKVTLALENLPYLEGFPLPTELQKILAWDLGVDVVMGVGMLVAVGVLVNVLMGVYLVIFCMRWGWPWEVSTLILGHQILLKNP